MGITALWRWQSDFLSTMMNIPHKTTIMLVRTNFQGVDCTQSKEKTGGEVDCSKWLLEKEF